MNVETQNEIGRRMGLKTRAKVNAHGRLNQAFPRLFPLFFKAFLYYFLVQPKTIYTPFDT